MVDISLNALVNLGLELAHSLSANDRYERLLNALRKVIMADAVALLRVQGTVLVPLSQQGLHRDVMGRRFDIQQQPRFKAICDAICPIRFAADSPLPDPYDGMLLTHDGDVPVHACMGLPLRADGRLIGVMTLDSMTPGLFDDIPAGTLEVVTALSAATLNNALQIERLEKQSQRQHDVVVELTEEALHREGRELIGKSPVVQRLKHEIDLVAASDFSILIEGETGVGKELVARTLHQQSQRNDGPLVYVNCAALPENLIESELFGHRKGAFTGADRDRDGKFTLADGGTIFLDEIGELPLKVQGKLLRVLQNQEIQPVGQDRVATVNVRVLAATNRVLMDEVAAGRFRADLYHRLSVYPLWVPPLREREGDVALLAGYFAEQLRWKMGVSHLVIEPAALARLGVYDWPGNVRELEHVISRAALRAKQGGDSGRIRILAAHIEPLQSTSQTPLWVDEHPAIQQEPIHLRQETERFQRELIERVLTEEQCNWSAAAKRLSTDRANLMRLSKRLGIVLTKQIDGRV